MIGLDDRRDKIAEAYADWFAEHSTDFQLDMDDLIKSLWPEKAEQNNAPQGA